MTSDCSGAADFRVTVEPSAANGLKVRSQVMADRPVTIRREHIGRLAGRLDDKDIARLNVALAFVMGLAEQPPRQKRSGLAGGFPVGMDTGTVRRVVAVTPDRMAASSVARCCPSRLNGRRPQTINSPYAHEVGNRRAGRRRRQRWRAEVRRGERACAPGHAADGLDGRSQNRSVQQ